MSEIRNRILKTEEVVWRHLQFLQNEKFKELKPETGRKLRSSLLQKNFIEAFNVWQDPEGVIYCLDGFHRCQQLWQLEQEGVSVPERLPANFIECSGRKEAAELVLVYSSQYAQTLQSGIEEFMQLNELDLSVVNEFISIPNIVLEPFRVEEEPTTSDMEEADIEEPDPSREPVVQQGDVFRLGEHVVMCGDSSNERDMLVLLAGMHVSGIVTSPPYAKQREEQYGGVPADEYLDWFEPFQDRFRQALCPDGSFFLNIKPHCDEGERDLYVFDLVAAMRRRWGWKFTEEYCWTHQGYPGALTGRYKNQFEPVYHFTLAKSSEIKFRPENVLQELSEAHHEKMDKRKSNRAKEAQKGYKHSSGMGNMYYYDQLEGARPGNVLRFNTGANSDHPATFPIGLPLFFIQGFSDKNDMWLDPFGGSGTTLMACEASGRVCRTMEAQPAYVEMIIRRWAKYCSRADRDPSFEHVNGSLTLEGICR